MAKFCTKCGKPLIEGQICECQKVVKASKEEPWRTVEYQNPTENTTENESVYSSFDLEKAKNAWYKFKNKVGIGEPETNKGNPYERNMKIIPDCIKSNEGEIPIRQYEIAKLRTLHKLHWAEGRLQITNKRVVFRAPGKSIMGRTVLQHEFAIDEIAGIEARKEPAFGLAEFLLAYLIGAIGMFLGFWVTQKIVDLNSFLGGAVALIALIAGNIPPFILNKKFVLKSLSSGFASGAGIILLTLSEFNKFVTFLCVISIILWWICCIINSFRTNLVFTVKTKSASGAIEIRRKKRRSLLSWLFPNAASEREEYTGFSHVFPVKDTEKSIREVGAIISDIQKLGDYGVEKWKL